MSLIRILLYCILIVFLSVSCNSSQKQLYELVKDWNGKEIVFPQDLILTNLNKDTFDRFSSDFTILSYIDSMGCLSCKLNLSEWSRYMREIQSERNCDIDLLLCFDTRRASDVYYLLRRDSFETPIFMDTNGSLNKLNHFSTDKRIQTFLLDKDNKILAMGNPIHNPRVKDLYLRIIQGENASVETVKPMTTVSVDRTSMDMGKFGWQQEQTTTFTLTNTGDNLLAIEMVDTSCGCITVEYDKEPVRPGDSVTLRMTYKAEQPEFFSKTLTVYCNAENAPLRLTVKGTAE